MDDISCLRYTRVCVLRACAPSQPSALVRSVTEITSFHCILSMFQADLRSFTAHASQKASKEKRVPKRKQNVKSRSKYNVY